MYLSYQEMGGGHPPSWKLENNIFGVFTRVDFHHQWMITIIYGCSSSFVGSGILFLSSGSRCSRILFLSGGFRCSRIFLFCLLLSCGCVFLFSPVSSSGFIFFIGSGILFLSSDLRCSRILLFGLLLSCGRVLLFSSASDECPYFPLHLFSQMSPWTFFCKTVSSRRPTIFNHNYGYPVLFRIFRFWGF